MGLIFLVDGIAVTVIVIAVADSSRVASCAPTGHVPTPLVLLVGVRDFLADDDLVLDDHPRVQRFVPVQKPALSLFRDVQQNPPGHSDLVACMDQGIVFVVGPLDEAAVKAIPGIVGADLSLADDDVVEPRTLDEHELLILWLLLLLLILKL